MYQYDERPRLTLYHATAFYSMKHQRLDCLEIRLWCQLSSIETCDLLIPFSLPRFVCYKRLAEEDYQMCTATKHIILTYSYTFCDKST